MKKYLLLIIINSFLFSEDNFKYKINILGMPAAKCEYSLVDTIYLDIPAYKINYKVKTTGFYNLFYKVKNKYSIIFKKGTYEILSYSKSSTQPSLKNKINTTYFDNKVEYDNGIQISNKETNIFVLLYMLSNQYYEKMKNFPIIDREGKKYYYKLNSIDSNRYSIDLKQLSDQETGVVEHTDVFTWGLFLPNTENEIVLDNFLPLIDKCIFKKGIIKMVAKRVE